MLKKGYVVYTYIKRNRSGAVMNANGIFNPFSALLEVNLPIILSFDTNGIAAFSLIVNKTTGTVNWKRCGKQKDSKEEVITPYPVNRAEASFSINGILSKAHRIGMGIDMPFCTYKRDCTCCKQLVR